MKRTLTVCGLIAALALIAFLAGVCQGRDRVYGPETGLQDRVDSTRSILLADDYALMGAASGTALTRLRGLLPDIPAEHVVQAIAASGTWTPSETVTPSDTLPVEVSAVELIDGSKWLHLTIGDKPVHLDVTEWFGPDPVQIVRRWQAHLECAAVAGQPSLGIGLGYRVCEPFGIGVAPTLAAAPDLSWAAAELRITKRIWSGVSGGIGGGYRIGDDPGLHLSAGVSIEL